MITRPWYPFYPSDYDRDTGHLTFAEHGAYRLLLNHYYSTGIPLPSDTKKLGKILRANCAEEFSALERVLAEFFVLRHGKYHNNRADREILKAEQITESKRKAGSLGGAAARGKSGRKPNSEKIADVIADELQENTQSQSQSQSQSHIESSLHSDSMPPDKPKRKTRCQIPEGFPFQGDLEWAMNHWLTHGRVDLCDQINEEEEKFRDHHRGKATASADWPGSWRTWTRNAIKFNNGGHHARKANTRSAHDKFIAAAYSFATEGGPATQDDGERAAGSPSRPLLPARLHGTAGKIAD